MQSYFKHFLRIWRRKIYAVADESMDYEKGFVLSVS